MKLFLLFVLAILSLCAESRHLHKRKRSDVPPLPLDVVEFSHMKPTRFLPLNNPIYYKRMEPCEEGKLRDFLGICREVWK